MEIKYLSQLLLILILYGLFCFYLLTSNLKNNFKKNWPYYRCNPLVMPFASHFGVNPSKNFNYCVQNTQKSYMGHLLHPINYNMNILGNVTGSLSNSLNMTRAFINNLRNSITSITGNIFTTFLNILIEVQMMTINIKDLISKLVGVVTTLLYTMDGSMKTASSVWNGPPGSAIRAVGSFCFHPNTKVKLQNGEIYKMKDLPLNSVLKNGAVVKAVMNISNLKKDGTQHEIFYEMNGEDNNKLYVTGSHLVFDKEKSKYVAVKNITNNKIDLKCDNLACLITDNHTIPIGEWIFHDWEDDNGSPSKDLNY